MTVDAASALRRALTVSPVILILRDTAPDLAATIAAAASTAGVGAVEITIETGRGRAALREVASRDVGLLVGAGTVRTRQDLEFAAQAGAAFTVAPGLDIDVVRAARKRGIVHVPGVATATETLRAWNEGLTLMKAFPASVLGATWISAMRGPFPEVGFVATGGVSAGRALDFLHAGALGVGVSVRADPGRALRQLQAEGLIPG